MAITVCRVCQEEVSTEAKDCPHCGAPFPSKKEWKGSGFEWKSGKTFYGYPLVHIAFGRDTRNKLRVAKGVIAIGQFAIGLITLAQFGIGILFGFGQFIFGATAIAQFAISILFGAGQFSTGYIAIGQFAFGFYVLCQMGFAKYIWTPERKDMEVIEILRQLYGRFKNFLH
jgi:hypothetical protein